MQCCRRRVIAGPWAFPSAFPASMNLTSTCVGILAMTFALVPAAPARADGIPFDASTQIATYSEVAYRNYEDAYLAALKLKAAVDAFVDSPADDRDEALAALRQAWLDARPSYGQTEAFRFYEGPIDFGQRVDGSRGPEGLINAWPLNEAYIDAVRGDPTSGLVNDESVPITHATLVERNARDDEADVTTGYHAIEFLLWGQDFNAFGPGLRSARDFVGGGAAARRRQYLQIATDLLVENLKTVVDAWAPARHNYREEFAAMDPHLSLSKILTGLATLSGFELAFERLATALDSGSQEDEQSCFSDNTHADVLANATGVANVYFGRYGDYRGAGLNTLLKTVNPQINALLEEQIQRSVKLAAQMDQPFDQTLASPPGSPRRARVEALVTSLQTQARLFRQAGAALGVDVAAVEYD
jgi:putative iron-regulated protein